MGESQAFVKAGTVLAVLGLVAPQAANAGTNSGAWDCVPTKVYSGGNTLYPAAANTSETASGNCGDVGVRLLYRLYPGSSQYWTSWKYGATYASTSPGNYTVLSQHYSSGIWPFGPFNNDLYPR